MTQADTLQECWNIYHTLHNDTSADDIVGRKRLLLRYLRLPSERPSLLHSLMLSEATRIEKAAPLQFLFSAFLEMWDLDNLRPDDWEGFKTDDGKSLPSLVERMITLYVKEMQITPDVHPSDKFMAVMDKAIERWPRNEFMPRGKAMLMIKEGQREAATALYVKSLLIAPDRFYLWSELGNLVTDTELRVGMLCKALTLGVPDEYLVRIRTTLASLLCARHMYANAQQEINLVIATYKRQGWPLNSAIQQIAGCLPPDTASADNRQLYEQGALLADRFVFADVPSSLMVKAGKKMTDKPSFGGKGKKKVEKWVLLDQSGKSILISPRRFQLNPDTADGQCFNVKALGKNIVSVTPQDRPRPCEWIKDVVGTVTIRTNQSGSPFGFVQKCYVPAYLLKGLSDGDRVKAIAIMQDGKWRCIFLQKNP